MADDIPARVRQEVLERDGWDGEGAHCRICGRWVRNPGLHHIKYRSAGGLHIASNLVTVGWTPWDHDCHLTVAHGANARYWREILLEIAGRPELTALQVHRWSGTQLPR